MSKKRFRIEFTGEAVIELDDAVIDTVTDEWRSVFYNLRTVEDIAEHIGYNLVIRNRRLDQLDGWADISNELARIIELPEWKLFCIDMEEEE